MRGGIVKIRSKHVDCVKCRYAKLKGDLSGIYCKLGRPKPIQYCNHFFRRVKTNLYFKHELTSGKDRRDMYPLVGKAEAKIHE